MIKNLTLLTALILSLPGLGQGIVQIFDHDGELVNGSVVHKPLTPEYATDTVKLSVVITGDVQKEVSVRRHELWPVAGSQNFFCWGLCFLPADAGQHPTWVSPSPLTMNPGIALDDDFGAYHMPNGNAGTARFRFVWYNEDDPFSADTSWVDVEFGGTVGIEDVSNADTMLDIWPNPSAGADVNIAFDLDRMGPGAELVIYNVLGERAARYPMQNNRGSVRVEAGSLRTGVYFANIEKHGAILATRRLVISN